jgi:hypothetical protein
MMKSITCIFSPPSFTFVDEHGYITVLVNPSEFEDAQINAQIDEDWEIQHFNGGWKATKGERYVRTGGPLDGKTFD